MSLLGLDALALLRPFYPTHHTLGEDPDPLIGRGHPGLIAEIFGLPYVIFEVRHRLAPSYVELMPILAKPLEMVPQGKRSAYASGSGSYASTASLPQALWKS